MRPRALVFLLVLTVGDYLLWNWSIADSHDIVSLVAGLTLLPLAAVSCGALVIAGTRSITWLLGLGRPASVRRPGTATRKAEATRRTQQQQQRPSPTEPDSSPGKLAA